VEAQVIREQDASQIANWLTQAQEVIVGFGDDETSVDFALASYL
jgi:hypothetical protein